MTYPRFEQTCSAASYCQLKLKLFITFCDVNHQGQAMSELCVEPLIYEDQPNAIASWVYATDLFKNKFKALNALLNRAQYTITRDRVFLFPCLKISKQSSLLLRGQRNSFCFSSTLVSFVFQTSMHPMYGPCIFSQPVHELLYCL